MGEGEGTGKEPKRIVLKTQEKKKGKTGKKEKVGTKNEKERRGGEGYPFQTIGRPGYRKYHGAKKGLPGGGKAFASSRRVIEPTTLYPKGGPLASRTRKRRAKRGKFSVQRLKGEGGVGCGGGGGEEACLFS